MPNDKKDRAAGDGHGCGTNLYRRSPKRCVFTNQFFHGNPLVKTLDEELEEFAQRRLDEPYPYLILEARY